MWISPTSNGGRSPEPVGVAPEEHEVLRHLTNAPEVVSLRGRSLHSRPLRSPEQLGGLHSQDLE
eukprot:2438245-Alexandrium_andersonii.AAC.1